MYASYWFVLEPQQAHAFYVVAAPFASSTIDMVGAEALLPIR